MTGCIAAWNGTLPRRFVVAVLAAQPRLAYVAAELDAANQVPLALPLCTYTLVLPDGRTLSMSAGYDTRISWFGRPRPSPLALSVRPNATVSRNGTLRPR